MKRLIALLACAVAMTPAAALALPPPLDDSELESQRGGFVMASGLTFDFAADLKTFIDGQLALESQLSLADGMLSQVNAFSTPDNATTVLHQFSDGQLLNVLINTANDRTFRQELNLQLTLPGFGDVQKGMDAARLGLNLVDQVRAVTGLR
jgi:phospholipase/lecithinase/hemolysin